MTLTDLSVTESTKYKTPAVADPYLGYLHWSDLLVIVAYFVIVCAVAVWSSLQNRGTLRGYFMAGSSMNWIPVGASLFASNIGSGHFIGLAGSGAATGIGIAAFELNAIFVLMILGWVFLPVYLASGVYTMPEYMRKRFGGQRIRVYLSVLSLLLYIFTKISADLYAGAIFIKVAFKLNLYIATVILLITASVFTIAGGLTAVIWTDTIQTVIMIAGSLVLMILSFIDVGGYTNLVKLFGSTHPNTTHAGPPNSTYYNCGTVTPNYMKLLRPANDGSLPWPGVIFGLTISSVWYWCTDQVIVQRALAAKNVSHGKAGTILAAYLKFLPLWLIVFPGMVSRIRNPDTIGCASKEICQRFCSSDSGCTNYAYPTLVIELMPHALRGLMVAVMMSALVSSLTSIFNSSSVIFTIDIWLRIRSLASDVELMIVGRVVIVVLAVIGILWIPVVEQMGELFHYIQAVTSYLAPPVCAVYVLAVFWKRINEQGAFWGLMSGLVVGLTRFIWEYAYGPPPPCGLEHLDKRPAIIKDVHYLHFGIILFAIVATVSVVVSLLTKPIDDAHLVRLTYWTRFRQDSRIDISVMEGEGSQQKLQRSSASLAASRQTISTTGASMDHLDVQEPAQPTQRRWWMRAIFWICGIETLVQQRHSLSAHHEHDQHTQIYESPFAVKVLFINTIILLAIGIVFWVYFSL